jgi:HEAT repeat protein
MVRLLPRPDRLPVISKAVMALGRDGVDALIEAMSGTANDFERQTYIDALTASGDADEAILRALGSAQAELVHDAAEVAGRRRIELAVQPLGHLLKHNDERVRTAAWQALERIGTNEALGTLYGAGRNR